MIAAAQAAMGAWTAESLGPIAAHLHPTEPRPYAVLDYLEHQTRPAFLQLVLALGLTYAYYSVSAGQKFSALQRDLIVTLNAYNHAGGRS